jgi:hypothetical protein
VPFFEYPSGNGNYAVATFTLRVINTSSARLDADQLFAIPAKNYEWRINQREEIDTHLLSPKSPSPGIIYAFSFNPSSIQPVICHQPNRVQHLFGKR